MKKILVIALSALLLLAVGCTEQKSAKEPEYVSLPAVEAQEYEPLPASALPLDQRVLGDWFATRDGLAMTLALAEDGSYSLSVPGEEPHQGTWALEGGRIVLDGDGASTLLPLDDVLSWKSAGLVFRREAAATYAPAEIVAGAKEGDFDGYWKSHFVAVGEGTMLSSALGETTDVFVQGTRVALGGPIFGDVIVDMQLKDGALVYSAEGITVTLALQQDGLMRLTANAGQPMTLYLMSAYVEGVSQEPAA